jgi:GAF domain-containing protein
MSESAASGGGQNLQATALLKRVYKMITDAQAFEDIFYELEQSMLELLQAERLTIYRRDGNELASWHQTGAEVDEAVRVPIQSSSVTGYVALTNQPVRINDVYDTDELEAIHPDLTFEQGYDQRTGFMTESMIVVPLATHGEVIGAIQVINRLSGGVFSDQDLVHCAALAQLISQRFEAQLKLSAGPYRYLIQQGLISMERFEELQVEAGHQGIPVTILL